jgi:hypothetical protein
VDIQGTHSPARLVVRTYHNTPQLMTTHCLQVSNNHTCILGDLYVEKLAWCARGKQQTHLKRALWVLLCAFYYEHRQSQTRQNHLHGISEEARLQHKKCACECHRFGVDILPGACIALPYATASSRPTVYDEETFPFTYRRHSLSRDSSRLTTTPHAGPAGLPCARVRA